jgi:pantothenate kinase
VFRSVAGPAATDDARWIDALTKLLEAVSAHEQLSGIRPMEVSAAALRVEAHASPAEVAGVLAPIALGICARAVDAGGAGSRFLVGISGHAGAGKSVLGNLLTRYVDFAAQFVPCSESSDVLFAAEGRSTVCALLGIDGYHRTNSDLDASGVRLDKGRPHTFDTAALKRDLLALKCDSRTRMDLPVYDRNIHEPVAGGAVVPAGCPIVVVEGILILTEQFGIVTPDVANSVFDLALWLEMPEDVSKARVCGRKTQHGKAHELVEAHYARVDGPNLRDMLAARHRATHTLTYVPHESGQVDRHGAWQFCADQR